MGIFSTLGKLVGLVNPGAGLILNTVSNIAREITGENEEAKIIEALEKDPALFAQLETRLSEERVAVEVENTKRQAAVNATIQAELVSGSKWQKGWRPFNGYMFPMAIISCYFILPLAGKAVPPIPWEMWVLWASVLGVSAHSRGREKLTAMGNGSSGIIGSLIAGITKKK